MAGPYRYGGYRYGPKNVRDRVQLYGYGSLGLAWSDGALSLQLDRNMNSLGDRRLYGTQAPRSEEHTSELQSLMRISYAVFCLKKKNIRNQQTLVNLHLRYMMSSR